MRSPPLAAALLLAACNWGTRPVNFAPALGPDGALVAVRVTGEPEDRIGELYAVDSSALFLRVERLARIPWTRVHAMDVDRMHLAYDVAPEERLTPEKRARIAALSRFPQGLSGSLLATVLARLGQSELDEVARADLDSVALVAARASLRYATRADAIVDGYRRIGGDFPGMGEHWVNPVRIQSHDRLDAEHPSFLTYATIDGAPKLLGLGFLVSTGQDTVDVDLPGWPREWHEHSGELSAESGARTTAAARAVPTRIWVLHIWTVLENPEGQYAPDNWRLPFLRAGVGAPPGVDANAGRAFSLTVGGDEFLRRTLTDMRLRTEGDDGTAASVDHAIALARTKASTIASAARAGMPADLVALRTLWSELGVSLQRLLGTDVTPVLAPAHPAKTQPGGHAHGSPR
jgi:hypothetical protein